MKLQDFGDSLVAHNSIQGQSLMESSSEEIFHGPLLMPDSLLANGAFAAALESPSIKQCNFRSVLKEPLLYLFKKFSIKGAIRLVHVTGRKLKVKGYFCQLLQICY